MDGLIAPFFAHVKNKPLVRLLRRDGFEDVIPDGKVLLRRSGAPSMPVQIITWQGSVYLTTGWPEFVLSNGIQHGDVLYFELQSDMKMSVQICFRNLFANKSSGKDETGMLDQTKRKEPHNQKQKGNADKANADAENDKRRRLEEKEKEEEADDREVKEIKEEDEHQQEVEKDEFHIMIKKKLLNSCRVPLAYARHVPPSGEASYVYLTGPDGKQWKVHVIYLRSRYPILSAGWPKFQTHYKLKLDDVLRFKVTGKFKFEVVILRALVEID